MCCVVLNNTFRVWIQSQRDWHNNLNLCLEIFEWQVWDSVLHDLDFPSVVFKKNEFISMDIVPMGKSIILFQAYFCWSITMSLACGKDVGWCGEVESFYPFGHHKVDFCWIYFYLIFLIIESMHKPEISISLFTRIMVRRWQVPWTFSHWLPKRKMKFTYLFHIL